MEPNIAYELMLSEFIRANKKFRRFNSAHEGAAVIREEFMEFEKAVFWGSEMESFAEVAQLGAMCLRFLHDRAVNAQYPCIVKRLTQKKKKH